MSNNADKRSDPAIDNDASPKKKTVYGAVRKAAINGLIPMRQNFISQEFKDQDEHNDWSEPLIIKNSQELRKLKEQIAAEKIIKQEMKNDLMIIKSMLPDLFPPPKIEEVNESIEPVEKEAVPFEPSKQEPTVEDINQVLEKEVEPKEKKGGFFSIFTNLFKKKPAKVVEKEEKKVVPTKTVQQKDESVSDEVMISAEDIKKEVVETIKEESRSKEASQPIEKVVEKKENEGKTDSLPLVPIKAVQEDESAVSHEVIISAEDVKKEVVQTKEEVGSKEASQPIESSVDITQVKKEISPSVRLSTFMYYPPELYRRPLSKFR